MSADGDFKSSKARDSGAETCSVVVSCEHAQFRQGQIPPQRGETATVLLEFAAMTPKTTSPQESQKGKPSKEITGSQTERQTGSLATGC